MTNSIDDLSRLVGAVKAAGADIAPGYAEYVQLAFAVCTDCGEAGRAGFITLCSLSAKYNAAHADKLYTNALRQGRGTVHLGTAFHLAERAGVTLAPPAPESYEQAPAGARVQGCSGSFPHTPARTYNMAAEGEETPGGEETLTEGSEPLVHLPVFTQTYAWPHALLDILRFGDTPEQRDVLLLAAVGAIGASLGPAVRCLYSRRWFYPCLQLFVIAPPASGKGVLSWVRKLVEPIHDDIRSSVKEHVKQYRKELAAYNAMGRGKQHAEQPQEPKNSMFII